MLLSNEIFSVPVGDVDAGADLVAADADGDQPRKRLGVRGELGL